MNMQGIKIIDLTQGKITHTVGEIIDYTQEKLNAVDKTATCGFWNGRFVIDSVKNGKNLQFIYQYRPDDHIDMLFAAWASGDDVGEDDESLED